ncbi:MULTISPECIES: hypothetical protein [Hyphomicrobiales]|jgi:hypothetical protein|uniref:Uncharacterized protein n=1 Tax=Bosea massiliensis TaxID=151419 RepID=A0ABW0P5U4_9HYPH|nr:MULTISPECIES: hypothetical protein [Hyphomicrobiales]
MTNPDGWRKRAAPERPNKINQRLSPAAILGLGVGGSRRFDKAGGMAEPLRMIRLSIICCGFRRSGSFIAGS